MCHPLPSAVFSHLSSVAPKAAAASFGVVGQVLTLGADVTGVATVGTGAALVGVAPDVGVVPG